jgi:hypothetical protein
MRYVLVVAEVAVYLHKQVVAEALEDILLDGPMLQILAP